MKMFSQFSDGKSEFGHLRKRKEHSYSRERSSTRRNSDSKDRIITAAEIGVIATVGKSMVKVAKVPKVMIVSTGDELVKVDQIQKHIRLEEATPSHWFRYLKSYK